MVWFCHDVEEVFIGYKVSDSDKTKKAAEFVKRILLRMSIIKSFQVIN